MPANIAPKVPSVRVYSWVTLPSIFACLPPSIRRALVALVHNVKVHVLHAGSIPSSLWRLLDLETLNLSVNKLSGGRRGQLTSFLEFLIF